MRLWWCCGAVFVAAAISSAVARADEAPALGAIGQAFAPFSPDPWSGCRQGASAKTVSTAWSGIFEPDATTPARCPAPIQLDAIFAAVEERKTIEPFGRFRDGAPSPPVLVPIVARDVAGPEAPALQPGEAVRTMLAASPDIVDVAPDLVEPLAAEGLAEAFSAAEARSVDEATQAKAAMDASAVVEPAKPGVSNEIVAVDPPAPDAGRIDGRAGNIPAGVSAAAARAVALDAARRRALADVRAVTLDRAGRARRVVISTRAEASAIARAIRLRRAAETRRAEEMRRAARIARAAVRRARAAPIARARLQTRATLQAEVQPQPRPQARSFSPKMSSAGPPAARPPAR